MGLTTPFPEPDSEALPRVHARPEIIGLLRALIERKMPLSAFFDSASACVVTRPSHLDEAEDSMVLAAAPGAELGSMRAGLPITFVGFLEREKLQFTAPGAEIAEHEAPARFRVPIPGQMIRVQRRKVARVGQSPGRSALCRVPLAGGSTEREALRVLDISTGGLALLTCPERIELTVGSRLDRCRLDLPGIGGALVNLRVRHLGPSPKAESAMCCGCEFIDPSTRVQAMLARYVALCAEIRKTAVASVG